MAQKIWVGTDSGNEGDYSVAANWNPTGVPTDADDVLIGPGGTQPILAGLNQSSVTLASLSVTADRGGSAIGSADNYLQVGVSGDLVLNGKGRTFIDLSTGTTLATVKVNNTSPNRDDVHIKGNALLALITSGKLTWDSGSITDLFVQYRTNASGDSNLLLSSPTVTNAYCVAGLLEMDGAGMISVLNVAGSARALIEEGTLTTAYVWNGVLDWRTANT